MIDQPEDDVSQSRISSDLILSLKNLSKTSQVILVTHNPQLVVNLDADNVIILKKDEQQIKYYWGPLEHKTDNFAILDLVARTLDGGTDVIRKRWKRYDKSSL
jgi:predicted ATPase